MQDRFIAIANRLTTLAERCRQPDIADELLAIAREILADAPAPPEVVRPSAEPTVSQTVKSSMEVD